MVADAPEANLYGGIGFLEAVDRISDLFNGFSLIGVIALDYARARDLGAVVSDPGEAFRGKLAVGFIRTAEDIAVISRFRKDLDKSPRVSEWVEIEGGRRLYAEFFPKIFSARQNIADEAFSGYHIAIGL